MLPYPTNAVDPDPQRWFMQVTVKLEGAGLSERIVPETELEPFMPEDGDMVKLLLPDHSTEPGKVRGTVLKPSGVVLHCLLISDRGSDSVRTTLTIVEICRD